MWWKIKLFPRMTATLTEWDHAVAPPWKMVMCTNRRFVSRALNTEVASTERERERVRKFSQKFHGKLGSRVPPLQGGGGGNEEHHRHYY